EWALAGKLIEKFSPHCSEELFKQLEHTIYCIPPLKSIEYIKSQLAKERMEFLSTIGDMRNIFCCRNWITNA
ncbi:hypothetical protein SASC598P14_000130, partial [Snodgrassella alvi SCGC AB-598-P14]